MRFKIDFPHLSALLCLLLGMTYLSGLAKPSPINKQVRMNAATLQQDISNDEFRHAFPGFDPHAIETGIGGMDRVNQQFAGWPDMLPLGASVQVGDKTITIQDRYVVAGGTESMAFSPSTGEKRVTHQAMGYAGTNWNQVFIPPGGSLMMVQIQVQPESAPDCSDFMQYRFALEYPGLPAVEAWNFSQNERMGKYPTANAACLTSGWLYFFIPSTQIDPNLAWVTGRDLRKSGQPFSIWKLTR